MATIQVRVCEQCGKWQETSLPYFDISDLIINKWHGSVLIENIHKTSTEFCSVDCLIKFISTLLREENEIRPY